MWSPEFALLLLASFYHMHVFTHCLLPFRVGATMHNLWLEITIRVYIFIFLCAWLI
jgi:hypothetical protein